MLKNFVERIFSLLTRSIRDQFVLADTVSQPINFINPSICDLVSNYPFLRSTLSIQFRTYVILQALLLVCSLKKPVLERWLFFFSTSGFGYLINHNQYMYMNRFNRVEKRREMNRRISQMKKQGLLLWMVLLDIDNCRKHLNVGHRNILQIEGIMSLFEDAILQVIHIETNRMYPHNCLHWLNFLIEWKPTTCLLAMGGDDIFLVFSAKESAVAKIFVRKITVAIYARLKRSGFLDSVSYTGVALPYNNELSRYDNEDIATCALMSFKKNDADKGKIYWIQSESIRLERSMLSCERIKQIFRDDGEGSVVSILSSPSETEINQLSSFSEKTYFRVPYCFPTSAALLALTPLLFRLTRTGNIIRFSSYLLIQSLLFGIVRYNANIVLLQNNRSNQILLSVNRLSEETKMNDYTANFILDLDEAKLGLTQSFLASEIDIKLCFIDSALENIMATITKKAYPYTWPLFFFTNYS